MSLADVKIGRRFSLWNDRDKFHYIATVEAIDHSTDELTIHYEKDDCMKNEILNIIPNKSMKVGWDAIKNKIEFIFDGDVICPVCGSDDLNDLFMCSKIDVHEMGYHSHCIPQSSGYIIPNQENGDTWLCPMHQS